MAYDEKRFYCVNYREHLRRACGRRSGPSRSKTARESGRATLDRPARCGLVDRADPALRDRLSRATSVRRRSRRSRRSTTMPVIVRRRETGALVQRFVFPTTIADVTFKVDPRGALVATSRGLWGLGSKEASSSPLSDRGR